MNLNLSKSCLVYVSNWQKYIEIHENDNYMSCRYKNRRCEGLLINFKNLNFIYGQS